MEVCLPSYILLNKIKTRTELTTITIRDFINAGLLQDFQSEHIPSIGHKGVNERYL